MVTCLIVWRWRGSMPWSFFPPVSAKSCPYSICSQSYYSAATHHYAQVGLIQMAACNHPQLDELILESGRQSQTAGPTPTAQRLPGGPPIPGNTLGTMKRVEDPIRSLGSLRAPRCNCTGGEKRCCGSPGCWSSEPSFFDRFQAGRSPQTSSTLVKRNQEHIGLVCKLGY